MQCQFEDAIRIRVADKTIGLGRVECIVILATGSHHKLLDAVRVCRAAWVLQSKTFIVMIVTAQHDLSPGSVQIPPKGIVTGVTSMFAGGEARVVPVRQRTHAGVSRQIGLQPLFLRRTGSTTTDLTTVRIEGNQVPGADIIAIVAFGPVAGRRTEVIIVTARAGCQIFVVANGRVNEVFGASPAGVKRL
jgi:hypothetical protein